MNDFQSIKSNPKIVELDQDEYCSDEFSDCIEEEKVPLKFKEHILKNMK